MRCGSFDRPSRYSRYFGIPLSAFRESRPMFSLTFGRRTGRPCANVARGCGRRRRFTNHFRIATVRLQRFDNLNDLLPYRDAWDRLAGGVAFRRWTWLAAWWRHYGEECGQRELSVWVAFSDASDSPDSVRAILPAYCETTWTQGCVLRLLGDGEVCSDHLGLLVDPSFETDAVDGIAEAIAAIGEIDLVDFAAVDDSDRATTNLLGSLARRDFTTRRMPTDRCWAIDLPATWDEFLALQSKSHRKQIRQMERRVLDSPRAGWRMIESPGDFGDAWQTLVDLHQRRRQSLGEPGCFASPTWAAFHWDVAQQLLGEGRLRLSTLTLDGQPIAAEYHVGNAEATWAYQGGVDPTRLADEPGQLSTICSIRHAIAAGQSQFDFLRGDEPYKAHWRATPRQAYRLTAVPHRLWPRLRDRVRGSATNLRTTAKQFTSLFS
jgi:CelD/BcsL family acetyltransferase involved in cellulose biosynthesis